MKYSQAPAMAAICVSVFQITGCTSLPSVAETSGSALPLQVVSAEAEAYRAAGIPLADLLGQEKGSQPTPTMNTSVAAFKAPRPVARTQRPAKPVNIALNDKSAAQHYQPPVGVQVPASSQHDMMAGLEDYLTVMGF